MEQHKELLQRVNKKLGHFLLLNEVATKQQKRSLKNDQKKAMQADRDELTYLIQEVDKIIKEL